jgi:2,3-bisphosphoglycerate-independent phosphoglycerate mutase
MSHKDRRPVVLVVLDGWGHRTEREGNAILLAQTPTWDALWSRAPRTLLEASGLAVGLPEGQMGNSEVGHMNLGGGREIPTDLVRITQSIRRGTLFDNPVLKALAQEVRERGSTLHLCGLIGDGGVHAVDTHLFALFDFAEREGLPRVALHALLDGRDTLPRSAEGFMRETVESARGRAVIASLGGRYYGMDRDKRWPRTELWYAAMVRGEGERAIDPVEAIRVAYDRGESDEFLKPVVIERDGRPAALVRDGDALFFFNFRADRMRQIVRAFTAESFDGFDVRDRPRVSVATMTMYDETFTLPIAFPPMSLSRIVAELVSEHGRTMFRTAETEKYAHVTYFFNCGREVPFPGEERLLVPSPKVATYDLQPEMSAPGVTDVLCKAIDDGEHDFILCNYANGDMVGHTGVLSAGIKACEVVDASLARVLAAAERTGARLIVTADHGNCEMMIDPETGGPHTAHTTNLVPLVMLDRAGDRPLRAGGALKDVGPTVLAMLGIEKPTEMTGVDLREPGVRT